MPPDDDVHLRLVEHVAHVQPAGDVGRRQQQGEGVVVVRSGGRVDVEQLLADPAFGPARLDLTRIVSLGKFVRHV